MPPSLRDTVSAGLRAARDALKGTRRGERTNDAAFWALKDASFEVGRGEVVGIIGRNGAGKSTLLKILSRIVEPTAGTVRLRGRIASLLEVGTGFHPELTGRENIYLNGVILGMRKAEIDRKFDEIVAFSEIERFLDTPVKRYSSGMYVRLAFAVAAHLDPEILIVDEVLAVGDHEFQKKCLGKMKDVVAGGERTVLFVSHNSYAIRTLCSRAILLRNGRIAEDGEVLDVLKDYLGHGDQPDGAGIRSFDVEPGLSSQFREVAILDSNDDVSVNLICDEPWSLRMTYEVRRQDRGRIYLVFYIQNAEGAIAIFSDVRDASRDFDGDLPVGVHTFEIRFPPRTLAPGEYTLTIASGDYNLHQIDNRPECCSFEIHETGSKRLRRPGVIGLLLPWEKRSHPILSGVC